MQPVDILMLKAMHPDVMAAVEARFTLHRLDTAPDAETFLRTVGPRLRGLATGAQAPVDRALLERLPNLEIVASLGVGYDTIDTGAAAARGIVVTHTPDVLNDEVADLALGLLLATVRQIPQADRYLRAGHWPRQTYPLTPPCAGARSGFWGSAGSGGPSPGAWRGSASPSRITAGAARRTWPMPITRPCSVWRRPSTCSWWWRRAALRPTVSWTRRCWKPSGRRASW